MNEFLNLSPEDFNLFLMEEAQYRSPAEIDDLRRQYRDANSFAGAIQRTLAPEEGRRRSTFLPVDAPQGMSIWDAITSGEASPALPQGIVDLLSGGARAVESPAEYAQGIPPRADAMGDAMNLAGMLMLGGGAVAGKSIGQFDPTTTRIFAGKRAYGMNEDEMNRLAQAQDLFDAGAKNAEAFNKTGWFRGADGKLRFEIDDTASKVIGDEWSQTLGEFIDHPELFRLYPSLKDARVVIKEAQGGSLGSFNPSTGVLTIGKDTPEKMKSVALHEIQHAVQQMEDFTGGSTTVDNFSQQQAKQFSESIMSSPSVASARDAYYKSQGLSAEISPLYKATYIDKLDALTEKALNGRAKPRDITSLGDWYRWGDEIRSELGPMPNKAGNNRDYWIASAARRLRDKELEGMDANDRLLYEDALSRFETPKDRANAVRRLERQSGKVRDQARDYYKVVNRAKEAQQLDTLDAYLQNAGEVEARNVQTRLNPEKRTMYPWMTQDVPYGKQIVDNFSSSDDISSLAMANASPLGGLVAQGMVSQEEIEEYLRQKGM